MADWLSKHIYRRLFHQVRQSVSKLSKSDFKALALEYPELKLVEENGKECLRGKVKFVASYDQRQDALKLFRAHDTPSGENLIRDEYVIEVELPADFPRSVPPVREIGGRIKQIAFKHQVTHLRDLHVNETQGSTLCLCAKPEEKEKYPDSVNITHFITHLVVPFLYELSFYDKHGRWPWSEYGHGDLGIFEYYAEKHPLEDKSFAKRCYDSLSEQGKQLVDTQRQVKGHDLCPCNSKRHFRKCHPRALKGLWAMKKVLCS